MFFFTSNSAQIEKHVQVHINPASKPELQFFFTSFHFSKPGLIKHVSLTCDHDTLPLYILTILSSCQFQLSIRKSRVIVHVKLFLQVSDLLSDWGVVSTDESKTTSVF